MLPNHINSRHSMPKLRCYIQISGTNEKVCGVQEAHENERVS